MFKYLKKEEKVDFWDINVYKKDKHGKEILKIDKISNNWKRLEEWFDLKFPSFKHISNVKKIDFIIFTCSGY